MANKYIAFISYRHAELDSAIAKALHSLIEQYRIPRGIRKDGESRLGVVFRDQEELHAASDLSSEIQNALNSTEYLIVICSKNSVESPWVTREVDHFLQHHDRSQVLTVLASGEPMEVFPAQLTCTPEGEPIEPLAVDIRADSIAASRKKLRRELPRLISAILKCPYDALVMREHRRKTRRITAIAAGAMAVLLGFTSMVLLKNQQIELANDQLEVKNTQLNEANVALEEQKAAVQLRESQLLVQSALEDLDNADYYSAIQKAVDALPADASDNRPYYAPAEQVLMESMGVFRTGEVDPVLNTTVLEQVTDIADFVITEDGSRVVTTDEFGTVFCFDAESGQQLWCRYSPPEENISSSVTPHLFLFNQDQTVVRSGGKQLCAYDIAAGDLLWTLDVGQIAKNYLFRINARNSLLFAASYTTERFTTAYQLVEVDASAGQILQTIPFFDNGSSYSCTFTPFFSTILSNAGWLSEGSTRFYGAFADDSGYLQCFEADLEQGTSRIVYTSAEPLLIGASATGVFLDDAQNLYVVCTETGQNVLISALKIDPETGSLLWRQDIPYPAASYIRLNDDAFSSLLADGLLLATDYNFFFLDLETGGILCNKTVSNPITSMEFVASNNFAFSLGNGTCALGWVKGSDGSITLTTDQNFRVFAELESHQVLRPWGGGIVQLHMDETIFHLGVNNAVRPGSVLLIPKQQENTLHIVQPSTPLSANTYTALTSSDGDIRTAQDSHVFRIGSVLTVENCYHADFANANIFLDPATRQVTDVFDHPSHYYSGELFFLPDTLQPLTCNRFEGICLLNEDGSETLIYDPNADQDVIAEAQNWVPSFDMFQSASSYSADGSALLTAVTNTDALQIWKNGAFMIRTALPTPLQVTSRESEGKDRLLLTGANGWVLTSLHDSYAAVPLESFAAYDTAQNKWTLLQGDTLISDEKSLAFAQEAPLLAAVDQSGTVQVLDLTTNNTVAVLTTQLPAGSVLQMRFFLDDTHLAIKASGGHLLIYDLTTGTQVYRDQVADAYSSILQIFEDSRHGRIYLNCGSTSGLCLEQGSWTTLAKLSDLLYYDADTGLLYLRGTSSSGPLLYYSQIPDTMELVKQARQRLAEQS